MKSISLNVKKSAVELFAGAGGLALGVEQAGFQHEAVIELDEWACKTLSNNRQWPIFHSDTRSFDYGTFQQTIDLLAGGPPCQPFSFGGKHQAHRDPRDMFPEAIRAVRELQPRAFLFENVSGLRRKTFSDYFEYIILQLRHPEVVARRDEMWSDHFDRLQRHETVGAVTDLHYNIVWKVIDAADYGIPQRRERLFMVGFRGDIGAQWSFPSPTHSLDALLWSQFRSGGYWESHALPKTTRCQLPSHALEQAKKLEHEPALYPWRTVRDALKGLPNPERQLKRAPPISGHQFISGARSYPGHTGSPYDLPAKTLKAGVHGVPGGENMLLLPSGKVRYFTIRECARLQDFPDVFVFEGAWGRVIKQLGNAVPVGLGAVLARSIIKALRQTSDK